MNRSALALIILFATVTLGLPDAKATSCAPVAIDSAAYPNQIALSARGGSIWANTNVDQYAATGGLWFAERPVGTDGFARSDYSALVTDSDMVLTLRQTVTSKVANSDGKTISDAQARWKIVGEPGGPSTFDVKIDTYRVISWGKIVLPVGSTASVTLDGVSYKRAGVYHSPTMLSAVPVDVWQSPIALSSQIDLPGIGTISTTTVVVISVECGTSEDGDNPIDDEGGWGGPPDFPENPCEPFPGCVFPAPPELGGGGGSPCGDGPTDGPCEIDEWDNDGDGGSPNGDQGCCIDPAPPNVGPGVFMHLTTGNIWTLVPVFRTYAYGHTELDFHLRYDSIRKDTDSVVGYGWTHSYNRWIEEVSYAGKTYAVYHDAAGRRHAFQVDAVGNCIPPIGRGFGLIRVPDGASYYYELVRPNGVVEVFDGPGWKLSEIRDRRGRTTYLTYTNGKLTEIRSPHNRVATLTYDANNRVYEVFQPGGEKTVLTYTNGNLTDIKDPRLKSMAYQYDGSRRVTRETLRNGKYYTVEYGSGYRAIKDSLGMVMHKLVHAIGIPSTPSGGMISGFLLHEVPDGQDSDTNPEIWQVQRDNLGRLIKIIAPEYRVLTLRYGGPNDGVAKRNRLIEQTDARGNTRKFEWDAKGNLIKLTDEANNETNYEYLDVHVSGLRTKKIEPDQDAWEYHHAQENSSTSLIGDLIEIVDPLVETPTDARVLFAYETWPDDAGSPPVPLPGRVHRLTRTDRNGNQTIWEYDPSGNLTTFTRVAGDPSTGADLVTTYECDVMGRLTRRTVDRGTGYTPRYVVTAWDWDVNGRLESITDDPTPGLNLVHSATYDDHGNLEVLTNPRGFQTRFFYDHRNRRWKIRQADNGASPRETQIVYGDDDNIRRIRDARGNWTDFTYDKQDHLVQVTDAEGYVTFFTPDENGNVLTVQRGLTVGPSPTSLYRVDFDYDALNRTIQRVVDEGASPHLNLVTLYDYATTGGGCGCGGTPGKQLLHSVIDPAGKYTYLHYDKLDRLTKVVRKVGIGDTDPEPNSDDAVISYEYDPAGNLLAVTGAEGELTEYDYDAANRLWKIRNIDTVELPNVVLETILGRDGADNVTGMAVPGGNNYYLTYDAAKRLTTVEDDGLGSLKTLVQFGRDANGNATTRSTAIAGQTWTYEFNDFDEPWREYDPIVEPPPGGDRYTEFAYDANGNLTQVTDRNLVVTKREYDKLNRLTKVTEDFGGTDPTTANTNTYIEYNGAVQTKLKDHDLNTTEYQYDAALRLWKVIYPDDGGTGGGTVTLGYYPSGKLWTRTTQDGVVTTYTYNDLHQLTGRSYSTPSQPAESFAFDRSGRLLAADKTGVAEVDFVFDKIGRLRTETLRYLPSHDAYTTKYDYTVTGNGATRTITYPGGPTGVASGRVVVETYDRRLRQTDINGGTGVGTTWGYDDADRRDAYQRANGVAGQVDFDLNNRITHILADDTTGTPATLVQLGYGYDPHGNRLWTDNLLKPDRSEIYQYDARNRLTNFRRGTIQWNSGVLSIPNPLAHAQIPGAQTWLLDRRGNWLEFTEQVGSPLVSTTQNRAVANGANEYGQFTIDGVPGDSPDHDAKGNLLRDPYAPNYGTSELGQQYVYDAENRLIQVSTDNMTPEPLLDIEYDALGRRIESTDHTGASSPCEGGTQPVTTRHVYAGIQAIEEYLWCDAVPAAWKLAREFIWGPRFPEPVAMIDHTEAGDITDPGTPEVLHYVQDVLGSTIALTDASGAAVERYTYEPYGRTVIEDGAQVVPRSRSSYANCLLWTGQRYDPCVGLYSFPLRIHSPSLGRWLQRDPLDYADGPHLYAYVNGNPIVMFDPLGDSGVSTNSLPPALVAIIVRADQLAAQAAAALAAGNPAEAQRLLGLAQREYELALSLAAQLSVNAPRLQQLTVQSQNLVSGLQRAINAARIDPGFLANLSQRARDLLQNALNAIKDHLGNLDLKAAIEQIKTGIKVKGYDQLKEVLDALKSIASAVDALKSQLQHLRTVGGDANLIKQIEAQIAALRDLYNQIVQQLMAAGLSNCPGAMK